jgi:hypothetical protein
MSSPIRSAHELRKSRADYSPTGRHTSSDCQAQTRRPWRSRCQRRMSPRRCSCRGWSANRGTKFLAALAYNPTPDSRVGQTSRMATVICALPGLQIGLSDPGGARTGSALNRPRLWNRSNLPDNEPRCGHGRGATGVISWGVTTLRVHRILTSERMRGPAPIRRYRWPAWSRLYSPGG